MHTMPLAPFIASALARVRATPVRVDELPEGPARGALFGGAAGVGFFLYETARRYDDRDLLKLASAWCALASRWQATASPADLGPTPLGIVLGASGIAHVRALVSAGLGDRTDAMRAVEELAGLAVRLEESGPGEVLGGAAGIALAARELITRLPVDGYAHARDLLTASRDGALRRLLEAHRTPLTSRLGTPLGFAHGAAGELYTLVSFLGTEHAVVRARLVELAEMRELDEEGLVCWPFLVGSSLSSEHAELLGSWCNGAAGHSLLWTEVAAQTKDPSWMTLARQAAMSTSVLRNGNASVCCGDAGHAIALARFGAVSGEACWARYAYRRLRKATRSLDVEPGLPLLGLWQGALGVALTAMAHA